MEGHSTKIAYVTSTNRSEYHESFRVLLTRLGEVLHIEGNDNLQRVKDYDIVFVEGISIEALECVKYSPKKLIVRSTGVEIYEGRMNRMDWSKVWKLVTYSQHQINYFKNRWKDCIPKGFGIIPPIALLNKFTLKKESGQKNKVAVVANITGRKGLQEIPLFLKNNPSLHVHHLGQICAYGDPIKDYIDYTLKNEGNLDRYHWTKHIPHEELNAWLENKDYIWLPSIQEGFNRSVLEGMCKGVTPIIKRYGGADTLWPNEYLYDYTDNIKLNIAKPKTLREYITKHYSEEQTLIKIKKELEV